MKGYKVKLSVCNASRLSNDLTQYVSHAGKESFDKKLDLRYGRRARK